MYRSKIWKLFAYVSAMTVAAGIFIGPVSPALEVRAEADADAEEAEALPAFSYTGKDAYIGPIVDYMRDTAGVNYDTADVMIPAFIILKEDDSDKEDIRVWGDFEIFNYDLRGTTLITRSGGSYPGLVHLQETGDGYEVVSMDQAEDGANYSASIRRIVGNDRELLNAFTHMDDRLAESRVEYIRMYAEDAGLEIQAYLDFGWDPVNCMADQDYRIEYPEIAGKWASEEVDASMQINAPEEGCVYDVTIDLGFTDGTRNTYDLFGMYEMSTNTLYYWDGWVTSDTEEEEQDAAADGTLALLEDGTIEWINADSDPIIFVCTEPVRKEARTPAPAPAKSGTAAPAPAESGRSSGPAGHAFSGAYEPGITEQKARDIALSDAGVKEKDVIFVRTELSLDDGRWEYEVEFYSGQTEYDYDIDAETGTIISVDRDAEYYTPPVRPAVESGSITDQQALEIALQHAGLTQAEISRAKVKKDLDDGRWEYEIEFRVGWREYEYTIDATTGKIIEYDIGD